MEEAKSMTCFHLRPHKGIDRSTEAIIYPEEYVNEILRLDGVQSALKELKELSTVNELVQRQMQFPKVVFLGTGSCIPNKTRNVSSILVHTK